jgi:Zn-dependent peptidase ImmA (M78 family)
MRAGRCEDELSGAFDGYPVDVRAMAERMGLTVLETEWRGLPQAICLYPLLVVVLNRRRPETARRFDLAHEISHYVLGVEKYHTSAANQFAAELLMPAAVFKLEVLIAGGVTVEVCRMFGVSQQAARNRLDELKGP